MVKYVANVALIALLTLAPASAYAIDVGTVRGDPVVVDVTNTTIAAQRFQAREGERESDQGYGFFINKLNVLGKWGRFTVGLRVDGSLYWLRPEDRDLPANEKRAVISDGASRFRDVVFPSKVWVTYQAPGLEVTAGDSYVQFGRGLVLSMRRIDELGVDNSIFGAKVALQKDPVAVTLVAGLANPSRFDEATGRSILLPKPVAFDAQSPQPLFGSDRIVGAEVQGGRGGPVVLSTRAMRLTRCAPYRYAGDRKVVDGALDAPFGTCEPEASATWLASLPSGLAPTLSVSEVVQAGQGIEVPNLFGHGSFYLEGAIQRRFPDDRVEANREGNAIYSGLTVNAGALTNTLEFKSYRNFYPVSAGINASRAISFSGVSYNNPPTTEPITQDSMYGFFNACVTGGRLRSDYRINKPFLLYGAYGHYRTQSEVTGGTCDRMGRSRADDKAASTNNVNDGRIGFEWRFDQDLSWFFASAGVRYDIRDNDETYYREQGLDYVINKNITGPYNIELYGRHRVRFHEGDNQRDWDANPNTPVTSDSWREGEHYTSFKIAPKWIFAQGIEYTTLLGLPTMYFNGSVLYRFSSANNVKIFAGQQRGGLKCVNGVCKVFPPFEGVRAELTMRF